MKPSHITTPRTLAECTFVYGYASIEPMAYRNLTRERLAGWLLAAAIGAGLAALLVSWWSS